jgi:hypothetical protein
MTSGGANNPHISNGGHGGAAQGQPGPQHVPQGQPPSPPQGPLAPPQQFRPPVARRTSPLVAAGVVLAIALGSAALIVSLLHVGGSSTQSTATVSSSPATSSASGDTTEVDRALCQAIGPLLRESAEDGKAFVSLGHTGTPERDAGVPDYRKKVDDWVDRMQPILDKYANPPRYLTRTTQGFIDFTHSYADNIGPGVATDPDTAAWNNRSVAYGGPLSVCNGLGVTW